MPIDGRTDHDAAIHRSGIHSHVMLDKGQGCRCLHRGVTEPAAENVVHRCIVCEVTGVCDGTEADSKARKPLLASPAGQSLEISVCRNVIGLTRIADEGGRRREHQEIIERIFAGRTIEVRGTGRLDRNDRLEAFAGEVRDQRIVQHHGRMHDTLDRRAHAQGSQQFLHG